MGKHDESQHHHHEYEPLVGPSVTLYNAGPRKRQDTPWLFAYLGFVAATIAWGIALFYTGSPDFFDQISPDHLSDPKSCPIDAIPSRRRGLFSDPDKPPTANLAALMAHPVSAMAGTLGGSLALGVVFVMGFRHSASVMINVALFLELAVPAFFLGVAAWSGNVGLAITLGVYCGLLLWVFYLWREQIGLVGRLLSVTGHALIENSGLVWVALLMPVVWGVLLMPTGIFAVGAVTNGHVVPNPDRADVAGSETLRAAMSVWGKGGKGPAADTCVDVDGDSVSCCVWQMDTSAQVYMGLLGVTITWTTLLLGQIKLFTVAGAVAQWYFSPVASPMDPYAPVAPSHTQRRTPGRVLLSLRHALGASIGSLCAASALLTIISYARQALDAAEHQMQNENALVRFVAYVLVLLLRCFLALVEFLTRFTTVRMAITGEAFYDAAHGVVDLMKRNALNAFGVWWLPPFILGNCQLVMSALFGGLVWGVSTLVYHTSDPSDVSAILLGVASGLLAMIVLSFVKGLLLNCLDAVFVCFAMDRDRQVVTRVEIHMVIKEIPGVGGAVFQQPDGGLAYGAQQQAEPGYLAPAAQRV